jgi:N-acetylglucosaminyl-diphospho-decaprenol L-rhamnosyltransferase
MTINTNDRAKRPPRLSVVIVTWNARDFLRECLDSIYGETSPSAVDFEIFVVDNGSDDGSADMVAADFPSVRLIRNSQNLGFPKANNMALERILKEGRSDLITLVNSDIVIEDRAIEKMAACLNANPGIAAVGPAFFLPDGRFQVGTGGYLPTAWTMFNYFSFLFKVFPQRARGLFIEQAAFTGKEELVPVEWLSGGCLTIRRAAVERIGLLDEDYFFYAEDLSWGRRMKREGFLLAYDPQAKVVHYHGVTYRTVYAEVNTKWLGMLFHYVRKDRGAFTYGLVRIFSVCGYFFRLLFFTAGWLIHRTPAARQKLLEIRRFFTFSLTGR